jgi:ribose/xylose/arabinose/galactoside ABC-type transport system permease subunit
MFRPIRLLFLIVLAFLTGVFMERQNVSEACAAAGGQMDAGLCRGLP